jgi:hypothetical protein
MTLHENPELFQQAVTATAQRLGLKEIYVEKDYWVTFALHQICLSPLGGITVFKGGTSLSKCHRVIARFSEDIDLVIYRQEGESANQLNKKISKIGEIVTAVLPEVQLPGITHKMGNKRKTAHAYPHRFDDAYGQARPDIILEVTYLGNSEPNTTESISCLIAEMLAATGAHGLIEQFGLQSFPFLVLSLRRTFCEKVISLVRFSYDADPPQALATKIRHTYDLHLLLQVPAVADFLASADFEALLNRVGLDDRDALHTKIDWLYPHPKEALIFRETEAIWAQLRGTYHGSFRDLVFGELPAADAVRDSLGHIATRLQSLNWTVEAVKKMDA